MGAWDRTAPSHPANVAALDWAEVAKTVHCTTVLIVACGGQRALPTRLGAVLRMGTWQLSELHYPGRKLQFVASTVSADRALLWAPYAAARRV